MSFLDMLSMSAGNLWRRKLRTALTILGVLIGTASIVAMLSLAIGMKSMLLDEYSSYGSATQITVTSDSAGMSDQVNTDTMLTEDNQKMFEDMDYVTNVYPVLEFSGNIQKGRYEGYAQLKGVDKSILEEQELAEGEVKEESGSKLPVIAGNWIIYGFGYSSGDQYYDYYSTGEMPDVDLMKDIHSIRCYNETGTAEEETATETDSEQDGDSSTDGTEDGDTTQEVDNTAADSSYDDGMFDLQIDITGVMEGDENQYSEYSDCLLTDIDSLKAYLLRTYGRGKIPNQPKVKGKPVNGWVYNSFVLEVDSSDHVEEVQQNIQDMGFSAQSNREMLESIQSTMQIVELVLGGIGMVAFLVAAIGIANTMMMSTYERTKEIGVMKVLGCDMRDIRRLFLSEAAFIGFIGGVIGLLFSVGVSAIVNSVAESAGATSGNISIITWWLAVVAVAFSTLMGILAGYFPARRAMKLSPLAAIRTE